MTEEKDWNKLTVLQLKEELTSRGFTGISGKKADLVERLSQFCKEKAQEKEQENDENVLVISEEPEEDDKKETEAAVNGKEPKEEPVAMETEDGDFTEGEQNATAATSGGEKEETVDADADGDEVPESELNKTTATSGGENEESADVDDLMITLDKVGDVVMEEDSDTEAKTEDDKSWKRKPRPSDETKAAEAKTEAAEESEKKDADKKTPEPERIRYRFKGIEKVILDKVASEARVLKQVSMFPLTMADLARPEILECLDRCSSFNVNFVNESSPGKSWQGLLKMDFKTVQDALNAKDMLPKMGEQFTVAHKSSKGSVKDWFSDKKPMLTPQIEQLLYVGDLPEDVDEFKIQEEFPQANLILMPFKDEKKMGDVYVNFPDRDSMVKAITDKKQILKLGEKECKIEVVRQKGLRISEKLKQALFGDQMIPSAKPQDEKYEGLLSKTSAIQVNNELRAVGNKYNSMRNKLSPIAINLKKKMDGLVNKLQMNQRARQKMLRDRSRAKRSSDSNKEKEKTQKDNKSADVSKKTPAGQESKQKPDVKKDKPSTQKEGKKAPERRMSGHRIGAPPQKHVSPRGPGATRGRGRGRGYTPSRSGSQFQGRNQGHSPMGRRREDRKRMSNWDSQEMGMGGGPGIMSSAPMSLADLISQVGSGGASVNQLMSFMQQHQSHGGDAGMASLRDSIQQQLGVYGAGGGGGMGVGTSGSFLRNIPSLTDEPMDSRMSRGGFGNRGGQQMGSSPRRSDEGRFRGERRGRNSGGHERHAPGDRRKQEEGDSKTVNLLMQLSSMLGSHLEKQELQMQEIRGQVEKVSEPRGRGPEKKGHRRTSPQMMRERHGEMHDDEDVFEPQGKRLRVDNSGNRSGFTQQDRGFTQQDRGFDQQDRGFDQQDRGFDQHMRGFDQQDRGFGNESFKQMDRGYGQQERGYSQQERGYGLQERGYSLQDSSPSQRDRGFTSRGRDFDQQERGFMSQGRASSGPDKRGNSGIGSMKSMAGLASASNYGNQRSMLGVSHSSLMDQYDSRRDSSVSLSSRNEFSSPGAAQGSRHSGSFLGNKQSPGFQSRGGFQ